MRAVQGRCEVYMDGGVRRGTDVLKALALGAKAVFIGRPVLWGLACQVKHFSSFFPPSHFLGSKIKMVIYKNIILVFYVCPGGTRSY